MVKLRIMGTPNDIKWFVKLIHRHKKIKVNCTSDNLELHRASFQEERKLLTVKKEEGS